MTRFQKVNRYVKIRNVHFDKKSHETTTGRVKPKYKLTGHPIEVFDQFIFFVFTGGHPDAYHKATRIKVEQSEWTRRNPSCPGMLAGNSFIDVMRHEVLTTEEVAIKMVDPANGFKYVAELPQAKFEALQKKLLKARYLIPPPSRDIQRLIAKALEVAPAIMRKLGI